MIKHYLTLEVLQAHLKAPQAEAQPKLLKELANRQYSDC